MLQRLLREHKKCTYCGGLLYHKGVFRLQYPQQDQARSCRIRIMNGSIYFSLSKGAKYASIAGYRSWNNWCQGCPFRSRRRACNILGFCRLPTGTSHIGLGRTGLSSGGRQLLLLSFRLSGSACAGLAGRRAWHRRSGMRCGLSVRKTVLRPLYHRADQHGDAHVVG